MADKVLVSRLKEGVSIWSAWKTDNVNTIVDLSGADLSNTDLRGADLRGANLSHANLSYADLSRADLANADLRHANMNGTLLEKTELRNAKLDFSNLESANLEAAYLHGATLNDANLSYANFSGADLTNVQMNDAKVIGATFTKSIKSNKAGITLFVGERKGNVRTDLSSRKFGELSTLVRDGLHLKLSNLSRVESDQVIAAIQDLYNSLGGDELKIGSNINEGDSSSDMNRPSEGN